MVEVLHGRTRNIMGSGRGVEQAKATISCATLGRIWMDHTREETGQFQGDGHSPLGKPPNLEVDSTHGAGAKVRCTPELQRGDYRYPETHDHLETKMGGVQGSIEKDGLEYGRHSLSEC